MASGRNSTLTLNPRGLDALTLHVDSALPQGAETYRLFVDLGRMDFNEEQRLSATESVPLTFPVIIKATTSDARRTAYRALHRAVTNYRGGTLAYLPEGAGASVLTTYYHYTASEPPRLLDVGGNRWDKGPASDNYYTLQVDVELKSYPMATSDPDTPINVPSLTGTLDNWYGGGANNRITVTSTDLQGTHPALVQLLITPNSDQALGRIILFRRSARDGTLENLYTLYEAEDGIIIAPSAAWTAVTASARGGGVYMQCAPATADNGLAQGVRFSLSYPTDSAGRFAVFGVVYDGAATTGVWTHQVKLTSGNVVQAGDDDYYAASLKIWQLLYMGEFELPLTDLSDLSAGYDDGPYLEWYSSRASGDSEFRLDALLLVWVSDRDIQSGTALDVVCNDEGGLWSPYKLLIENLLDRFGGVAMRAYVAASDNNMARVLTAAPRGDFITLDPDYDHLLVCIQERYTGVLLADTFENYVNSRFAQLASVEAPESWTDSVSSSVQYVEGAGTRYSDARSLSREVSKSLVSGFGDTSFDMTVNGVFVESDFICLYIYAATWKDDSAVTLNFGNYANTARLYADLTLNVGHNFVTVKRSAFTSVNGMTWEATARVYLTVSKTNIYLDFIRSEKSDLRNTAVPNATGSVWGFYPDDGVWSITSDVDEDTPGETLAYLYATHTPGAALINRTASDVYYRARVYAKRDEGDVGLLWRADDCTLLASGNEQGYGALLDTTDDRLHIYRYTSGALTAIASPVIAAEPDRWYTMGVITEEDTHNVYAALSSGLAYDDSTLYTTGNLLHTFTDSTYDTGKCGLRSNNTLGRFDNVYLESRDDKMQPTDQITIEGKAIFRTITPFDENG